MPIASAPLPYLIKREEGRRERRRRRPGLESCSAADPQAGIAR
jgi:hypothetical protein